MGRRSTLLMTAALLAACSPSPKPGFTPDIGARAQPVRLEAWVLGGGGEARVDFAAYAGRIVLLERWATWCSPCVEKIPALIDLQARHPRDLAIVSLSAQPAAAIAAFLDATTLDQLEKGRPKTPLRAAVNYPVASASEAEPSFDAYFGRLRGVPSFYIIGRDGRVEHALVGSYDVVLSELARLLEGRERTRSEAAAAERLLAVERALGAKAEDPAALRERLNLLAEQARLNPPLARENSWKALSALAALWSVSAPGAKAGVRAELDTRRRELFAALEAEDAGANDWVNLSYEASEHGDAGLLDAGLARTAAERAFKSLEGGRDKVVTDMAYDALARARFLAGDPAGAAEAARRAVAAAIPVRRPRFEAALALFEERARDPRADPDALIGRHPKSGLNRAAFALSDRRGR